MMNRYIIDEEKLDNIADLLKRNAIFQSVIDEHLDGVYNHPYNLQAEQSCIWTEDEDGIYQTSCGNSFEFMNGTPNDNHTKFCPYCGKVLTQSKGGKP
jgi:hypothetical protein